MNNVIYLNCRYCKERIINKKEDVYLKAAETGICEDCFREREEIYLSSIEEFEELLKEGE